MKASDILDIIEDVAGTSSRTAKHDLLSQHFENEFLIRALRAAYDPYVTYGLTPPKVAGEGTIDFTHDTEYVWMTLDNLASRKLTGNAAHDTVFDLMQKMTPKAAELLWRILSKDMRAGFTSNTLNRIKPGTIKTFDVMLAHKYEERHIKKWPVMVEPKLDGVRVICVVEKNVVKFYSRTGKQFSSVDHLAPHVLGLLESMRAQLQNPVNGMSDEQRKAFWYDLGGPMDEPSNAVLDGEIVSGQFNKTVGDIRRGDHVAEDAAYTVFDLVPLDAFKSLEKKIDVSYQDRLNLLRLMKKRAGETSPVNANETYFAHTPDEIQELYASFRNRGLEGAIVKPLDDIYTKKRSRAWLKMKAEESADIRITGAEEGTGKNEGKLGALICDFNGVQVRVGGGLTDEQRDTLWQQYQKDLVTTEYPGANNLQLIGRLIEVEYHEITPDGSLRHPRFVGWRDDKDEGVEEAA